MGTDRQVGHQQASHDKALCLCADKWQVDSTTPCSLSLAYFVAATAAGDRGSDGSQHMHRHYLSAEQTSKGGKGKSGDVTGARGLIIYHILVTRLKWRDPIYIYAECPVFIAIPCITWPATFLPGRGP